MPQSWKTVRLFISSTFRDMHAERDHLVRFVFPELKERCRKIHVHLIDVDLRWGVTEKDAQEGKALEICLDEIDTCRPYFLGLLGHRYGHVPQGHQHSITAQEIYHGVLHNDLPKQVVDLMKILEGKLEGKPLSDEQRDTLMRCYVWDAGKRKYMLKEGITAKESAIIQSAFQQYAAYQKDRSFFFFRKESLTATLAGTNRTDFFEQHPEDRVKLEALKQEIRDARLPWFEYDDIEAFGQLILETLWKRIETEIGQEILKEKGWLEEELEFHELFIAGITRRFVGRRDLLDRMHGFLEHDAKNPILVITGEPGCGKSALMARFSEEAKHRHPDWLIIPNFVGASPDSTIIRQVLRRVCMHMYNACDFDKQMQERISRITGSDEQAQEQRQEIQKEYAIPDDYKELCEKFPEFLGKASHSHRVLIILDAANQLDKSNDAHAMRWLPQPMPQNVSFVISTPAGEVYDALMSQRTRPEIESMHGLTEPEIKEFVNDYLREISKAFPNQEVADAFFGKVKNGNPLYIIVALEELRVFGRFEEVAEEIQKLPEDVPSLFGQMLGRIERDYQPYPELVRDCVSYIACGRYGMASEELQALLKTHAPRLDPAVEPVKLPDMLWARLYRTFGAYLINRAGVTDFFHTQLKEAVGRRYLSEETERNRVHKTIADYFETRWREPYTRALEELPFQLFRGKMWLDLYEVLTSLSFMELKIKHVSVQKLGMQKERYYEGIYKLQDDFRVILENFKLSKMSNNVKDQLKSLLECLIYQSQNVASNPDSFFSQMKWEARRHKRSWELFKPIFEQQLKGIDCRNYWIDPYIICDASRVSRSFQLGTTSAICFDVLINERIAALIDKKGYVVFLNVDTGQVIFKLFLEAAYACCFAKSKRPCLIVGGESGILYFIDLGAEKVIAQQQVHNGNIFGLATNSNGRFIATCGGNDRRLHIINLVDLSEYSIRENYFSFNYCVFSPAKDLLAVASASSDIFLHSPPDEYSWYAIYSHDSQAMVCAFSPSGSFLASGSKEGELVLWDAKRQFVVWRKRTTNSSLIGLVFLDDHRLISGNADGSVDEYDVHSGKYIRNLSCLPGEVYKIVIDRIKNKIFTIGGGLWAIDLELCNEGIDEHLGVILSIATLTKESVICAGENPGLAIINVQTDTEPSVRIMNSSSRISHVSLSSDKKWLITGSATARGESLAGRVELRDLDTNIVKVLDAGNPSISTSAAVWDSCFIHEGKVLVVAFCSETYKDRMIDKLVRWDLEKGKEKSISYDSTKGPRSLTSIKDLGVIVTSHSDGTVRVYSDSDLAFIRAHKLHEGCVWCCVNAPEFGGLITGGIDGYLKVSNINNGKIIKILQKEEFSINTCILSPDRNMLVSGASNGVIRFWRNDYPLLLNIFYAGTFVNSLAFSPEGDLLYFAGGRGLLGVIQFKQNISWGRLHYKL